MKRLDESSSGSLIKEMFKCLGLIPYSFSIIESKCLEKFLSIYSKTLNEVVVYGIVWLEVDYEGIKYGLASSFKISKFRSELMNTLNNGFRYLDLMNKATLIKNSDLGKYIRDLNEPRFRKFTEHVVRSETACYKVSGETTSYICFIPTNLGTYSFTNLLLNIRCLEDYRIEFNSLSFFSNLVYNSGETLLNALRKIVRSRASENLINKFLNYFHESLLNELHKGYLRIKDSDTSIVDAIIAQFRR
ncbi:MAG: hypothetical protein QXP21_06110 [Desulfurococcaceae archaeon]